MSRETTIVNGAVDYGRQLGMPRVAREDGVTNLVGAHYQAQLTDMDDPRLNGTFQIVWNEDTYDGIYDVVTAANRIDNAGGSCVGVEHGYAHPTRGWSWHGLYEGQGGCEGLTAIQFWEGGPRTNGHGIVFLGEVPEPLDPPDPAAS